MVVPQRISSPAAKGAAGRPACICMTVDGIATGGLHRDRSPNYAARANALSLAFVKVPLLLTGQ